ncbi:MAG TPA: 2-succinyl-5-enolpyruvyl-6-hydroxy-3-cyclohexene-1-carboxylic-acid synthase [Gemmatimonadales bacterium]|nr:2-succinyl-5-enolpyruvyl-6-hydroxy-3-cyclohexene-1-carboxylic-acid synthase [Gemmatimonadales bacterium]
MNLTRAAHLVQSLTAAGVAEYCVCPGGRNSPLVVLLAAARGICVRYGFEERSTAFFALGRARETGRPVAVVTTSGTAAAELLPAAVEAHYGGGALVLVTADRPPEYRATGAPQAIEQVGLFGRYAPTVFDGHDGSETTDLSWWDGRTPIHLNICFDEPLVDQPISTLDLVPGAPRRPAPKGGDRPLHAWLRSARRPLVLVGPLEPDDRDGVRDFLLALGAPVFAEATSGLREDPALESLRFASGERILASLEPDAVLRIGGVPTVRFWRDLEVRLRDVPVCVVSRAPFPGLSRATVIQGKPGEVLERAVEAVGAVGEEGGTWLGRDRERAGRLDGILEAEPRSEPGMIRALSALVPAGALVYLGNSLPIREWDLAAVREARGWEVRASRGANGIDGQVSTFLGHCGGAREHWALVGDLTALYDLAAPWMLQALDGGPIRLVVVNNGGGQIFARLSPHAVLRNEHRIGFGDWARLWGLAYHRWTSVPSTRPPEPRSVIELVPDGDATTRFWRAHDALHSAT